MHCLRILGFTSAIVLSACGSIRPIPTPPSTSVNGDPSVSSSVSPPLTPACLEIPRHSVLSVQMDGMEVGVEVRSELEAIGPFGPERVLLSHMSLRMRMGTIPFDAVSIRLLKLSANDGSLLYASHQESDPLKSSTCVVGFDGESWARRVDSQSSHRADPTSEYRAISLSDVSVYGMDLLGLLAKQVSSPTHEILIYYEPVLASPVRVMLSDPLASSIAIDGQLIDGYWIEAKREDNLSPVVRAFFDKSGVAWQEEYPTLSQIRRRITQERTNAVSSDLRVGLFSTAYLGNASAADRAHYALVASPERLDALSLLGDPSSQTLIRLSPTTARLEVRATAPDGSAPPLPADLEPSRYVQPRDPVILGALRYLTTQGRSGRLSKARALNATALVADLSLKRPTKGLFADPEQAAPLLSRYVSALLPNKEHTFSMVDAVTALDKGFGDCTEHAVLLASLLRAHGIPARLVSGMLLTQGGLWVYHMWNEYWDGATWRAIDSSTGTVSPGATYVAIGRGVASFDDARADLAEFIEQAFAGVSFDLVSAWSDGMALPLARPRRFDLRNEDSAVLESLVYSSRGDHEGALLALDSGVSKDSRTIAQKLLRLTYLSALNRCPEVLEAAASLRTETSAKANLVSLWTHEFLCHVRLGQLTQARSVLDNLKPLLPNGDVEALRLESLLALSTAGVASSRSLLESAIDRQPDCLACLSSYIDLLLESPQTGDLDTALALSLKVLDLSYWSDADGLYHFATVLFRLGKPGQAALALDHGLVLRPADSRLLTLRSDLTRAACSDR